MVQKLGNPSRGMAVDPDVKARIFSKVSGGEVPSGVKNKHKMYCRIIIEVKLMGTCIFSLITYRISQKAKIV